MKLALAASAAALALAVPAAAPAATLTPSPAKACYFNDERVGLSGTGFTPNSQVQIAVDGTTVGTAGTDSAGNIPPGGTLTVKQRSGEKVKTVTATDTVNPSLVASLPLRITALDVTVKPTTGVPGKVLRIGARGFASRGTLRAHIVKGRSVRHVRLGRIRGACAKGRFRKRLFSRNAAPGIYRVQFDTKRRYSPRTAERVRYTVRIFRVVRRASVASAAWTRLP